MAIRSEAASSRLNVQSQVARGDSQAVVSKFERMERRIDEMEAAPIWGSPTRRSPSSLPSWKRTTRSAASWKPCARSWASTIRHRNRESNRWKICWVY